MTQSAPSPVSSTNMNQPVSPGGDVSISSFATHDATLTAFGPDDDDTDETTTSTGLNPDPDYEKSAGAAELMTPDDAPGPEDNELTSEDTDDGR